MRFYGYNPKENGNITIKKSKKLLNKLLTIVVCFLMLLCFLTLATLATYYSAFVDGPSMYPTINAVNSSDIAYYTNIKTPKKGDIVIVDYNFAEKKFRAIKRLIATGGDTICYYNGHLLLNGEVLDEKYIEEGYNYIKSNPLVLENTEFTSADNWLNSGYNQSKENFETWCKKLVDGTMTASEKNTEFFKNYTTKYAGSIVRSEVLDTYVLTIPEGFIYFLGDNRKQSSDSSTLGPAEEKYMLAKVDFVAEENSTTLGIFTKELIYLFR